MTPKPTSPETQRDALNESQKKASEQQPGSYKERETAEKLVEIDRIEPGRSDASIQGIDPDR